MLKRDASEDPSLVELFRKRNRDSKKEQGGRGTLMAMRPTEEVDERGNHVQRPTHADVTWVIDLVGMSSRGTNVRNEYSFAMLCVDVGTRLVRGQLMKTIQGWENVAALGRMREGLGEIP